ncbi:MAG: TlyA family RNA methyltransferase [bacterium]|nr:TlyA family RNA methyltransferase [bacterium]
MTSDPDHSFASRAGLKLAAALGHFGIDPAGLICADLGCNVGGFVDCLLQRGATKVYAVDTGYGQLAWKLRRDSRVVVMERTNALHVSLPEPVGLVTVDVGWTRQHLILPQALTLLAQGGRIVTLIKPHYEAQPRQLRRGVLPEDAVDSVVEQLVERLAELGLPIEGLMPSPIRGQAGNREVLALVSGG